jgi:LacI family transcriptional regulator
MSTGSSSGAARKAVTRADVARYAGVSSAVVSYVVNHGPKPVAPATAARVREAIDLLGYRPNVTARALKLGTTGMLGLIVPDSSNPFFAEYALEIEQVAADRGMVLLMANSNSDAEVEAHLIMDLLGRQVDGLIVSPAAGLPRQRPARRSPTPTVYIDNAVSVPDLATIGTDAVAGSRLAVEHLLGGHGHDSVALLVGSGYRRTVDEREFGWRQAVREAGRPDGLVLREPFTREGGYQGGLRLLAMRPRPTAVFTSNDMQAVGLLRAAHELDVQVPEDLAIVSFDGTSESEYCWPPLTTARQPIREMAEAAVQVVVDPVGPPVHQMFPVELVIRRSCGCEPAPVDNSNRKETQKS